MDCVTKSPDTAFEQSLAILNEWNARLLAPVFSAINNHRFAAALSLLETARTQRLAVAMPEDVREALAFQLILAECRFNWHPDNPLGSTYDLHSYQTVIARFAEPASSRLAQLQQRSLCVYIRCNGTKDGLDRLSWTEIQELLRPLPERLAAPAWHQVALWAFHRKDLEVLQRAFEVLLLYPSNIMGQAKWQRVNLMYQLLSGRAGRQDVQEYVKLLQIRPQVVEFKHYFWPVCRELGLVDNELEEALEQRAAEIHAQDQYPGYERRTKSIRG